MGQYLVISAPDCSYEQSVFCCKLITELTGVKQDMLSDFFRKKINVLTNKGPLKSVFILRIWLDYLITSFLSDGSERGGKISRARNGIIYASTHFLSRSPLLAAATELHIGLSRKRSFLGPILSWGLEGWALSCNREN